MVVWGGCTVLVWGELEVLLGKKVVSLPTAREGVVDCLDLEVWYTCVEIQVCVLRFNDGVVLI